MGRVAAILGRAALGRILARRRLAVVASLGRRWLLVLAVAGILPLRRVLALLAVGRLTVALVRHFRSCFVLYSMRLMRSSSRKEPRRM